MFTELFGLLSSLDATQKGVVKKPIINLTRNRIKSISAYSSNSIFYFSTIVSDQCTPEEIAMVSRMIEKSCASFVLACISLMPFHRIRSNDVGAIEDYLKQFHQNMGINPGAGPIVNKLVGLVNSIDESVDETALQSIQNTLLEAWNTSRRENSDFVKIMAETVPVNDMYNESALDPATQLLVNRYHKIHKELDTWGFLGEATSETLEFDDDALLDMSDEEIYRSVVDGQYDSEDDDDFNEDEYPEIDSLLTETMQTNRKTGTMFVSKRPDFITDEIQNKYKALAEEKIREYQKANKNTPDAYLRYKPIRIQANMATTPSNILVKMGGNGSFIYRQEVSYPKLVHYASNAQIFYVYGNQNRKDQVDVYLDDVIASNPVKLGSFTHKTSFGERLKTALHEDASSLNEGNVRGAVNSIRFALESVSENKIMSCQSLSKLSTLESKLNKLKGKYAKYLTRYKRKYKENEEKGSKAKLQIRFNNMKISNPKAFMQEYSAYIKIINKRLKLIEKRRAELRKRKGIEVKQPIEESAFSLGDMDFKSIDYCDQVISEALSAPDSEIFTLLEYTDPSFMTPDELKDRDKNNFTRGYEAAKKKYGLSNSPREVDEIDIDLTRPQSNINPMRAAKAKHTQLKTFDREVFTDMDMKKANEAIPLFVKASIGFIVDETEEVVSRDIMVGIKANIHRAPSAELVNDLYNCIINKRKFLRFVKFITGEERSLADLLFGIRELKSDALDGKSGAGEWRSAFKRRRRWAKMSIPYLMKEYTPNGTVVMTMNEVQYIRDQYGIDVMRPEHVRMIMDADFLLSFIIIDQAEEMVYITYDGHGYGFQTYTYAMLEREQQNTDRMMRELYRSFSR